MFEIKDKKCKKPLELKHVHIFRKMEKEFPMYLKTPSLPENPLFIRKIKVNGSSCILWEQLLSKYVHNLLEKQSAFRNLNIFE